MKLVDHAQLDWLLDFPALVEALSVAFTGQLVAPPRHHHRIGLDGPDGATHLLMPAWSANAPGKGSFLGTKIVNVFPSNGRLGLPAVLGQYLLQSGETGAPLALIDGTSLTHWRTAATSALAARHLARAGASHLLMVGSGALAPFLIRAHQSVRPIRRITLWNHRPAGAEALARKLDMAGIDVVATAGLAAAAGEADIISCATLSGLPLIRGEWLAPGCHLDLVGAFSLAMRECDDNAIIRARVCIDTAAALTEGGDVAQAILNGAIGPGHVVADLAALCAGTVAGRTRADEITLFKSIGASIEDLAAAILVWQRLGAG